MGRSVPLVMSVRVRAGFGMGNPQMKRRVGVAVRQREQ
jgi:hypothetical protein